MSLMIQQQRKTQDLHQTDLQAAQQTFLVQSLVPQHQEQFTHSSSTQRIQKVSSRSQNN